MRELVEFWLFIAFVGMLLLLRFDANRFGVAEYDDEARHGGWRGWLVGGPVVLAVYALLGRALVGRRRIGPRVYRYATG